MDTGPSCLMLQWNLLKSSKITTIHYSIACVHSLRGTSHVFLDILLISPLPCHPFCSVFYVSSGTFCVSTSFLSSGHAVTEVMLSLFIVMALNLSTLPSYRKERVRVVQISDICWILFGWLVLGVFFVLSRQNSSQHKESAIKICIGCLSSYCQPGVWRDKQLFLWFWFSSMSKVLKLTGFLLDNQGYYKF